MMIIVYLIDRFMTSNDLILPFPAIAEYSRVARTKKGTLGP